MIVSSIVIVPSKSACGSYNPLPRAAGEMQYEAGAKPRRSNCILPEAQGSGLYIICTPLPWQQDKPCVKNSISAVLCYN